MKVVGTSQLLELLNSISISSLSWLVCRMCTYFQCFLLLIWKWQQGERGKGEDHDKVKEKAMGQLVDVKEKKKEARLQPTRRDNIDRHGK